MIVAVQLFLLGEAGQRYQKRVKLETGGNWEDTPIRLTLKPGNMSKVFQETGEQIRNKKRAKFRWFLAYTLINNPRLYNYRNKFLVESSSFENKVCFDF